jgi:hypothetical protein
VLRNAFGLKREDVRRGWRNIHKVELYNFLLFLQILLFLLLPVWCYSPEQL